MELTPGAKLGPYEIVSCLGKGGMGEVWKARDPRLNRDVAIKISAQQFTDRFEREARTIAALNHPNICTLYGVGPNYLVMELVEGPTLAKRITQGAIPLEEALGIAKQIADALEAAHEKNIVHRDLKPANVKVKPDGSVKVLDFGLAKSAEYAEVTPDSPTMMTIPGMILGTAAYMSPEQACGKPVDKRADIWAFGVVLYEMVTGKRLFAGETISETLAAVIKEEPDLTKVPAKLQRLLRRCLEKDLKRRLRDIGDAMPLIEETQAEVAPAPVRGKLPWAVAAVLAVIALVPGWWALRHSPEEATNLTLSLPMPAGATLKPDSPPAISPDGRRVAFVATSNQKATLWVRSLDSATARPLDGTEGASSPFWSPDGRFIGFFSARKLEKINAAGGPAENLCDTVDGNSGSWSGNGTILFGQNASTGIMAVPADGGNPMPVSTPDRAASEDGHNFPWFLPDGRHFLYLARNLDAGKDMIYVAELGQSTRNRVVAASSNAIYARPGYVLFLRGQTLMAQPFDAEKSMSAGDAIPIAEQVAYPGGVVGAGSFSVSQGVDRDAILVYTPGEDAAKAQLTWFDRTGKALGTVGEPGIFTGDGARVSPDGNTLALMRDRILWLHNLARGAESRFSFNVANFPTWSPDSSRIAFKLGDGTGNGVAVKAINGIGPEEVLDRDSRRLRPTDWSSDGRYIFKQVSDPKTLEDIWVLPLFGDRKPFPYLTTEANEGWAKLSPNGQFLAYVSDESKRGEIYVQTFPNPGGKWQISSSGGDWPVWSSSGNELFFMGADRRLMAAAVNTRNKFEASAPKPLFETHSSIRKFDVSKDGRFLIPTRTEQAGGGAMTVVQNWTALLKK